MHRIGKTLLVAYFFATGIFFASAQKAPEKNWNSARIVHEMEKMKHVGRVLYIAAHPDDENTQLISYLVNVKGIETAYMSLTRGDGGQDLLGPQVREELGVIRTQELLMARSVDGGEQFFSRANDFGFSKTAAETMHIWDSNAVLSDIVWVIRKFKPDIIITRFSPTYTKTHGHHQASAILAQRAFDAAANPSMFPEQLKYVSTWQAKSLFWNTSTFFFADNKLDTAGLYRTNIGTYIPLLGKSVAELAAESRSMHKSQGMGTSPRRGDMMEYFVSMKGEKPAGKDIFDDYNWDWSRIKGCENISKEVDALVYDFKMQSPDESISDLIHLQNKLEPFKSNYLVASKIQDLNEIILQCAGVYSEAISGKKFLPVGDSINVALSTEHHAGDYKILLNASLMVDGKKLCDMTNNSTLNSNTFSTFKAGTLLPYSTNISGPYWLEEDPTVGMYNVPDQLLRGLPQNPQQVTVHATYCLHFIGENRDVITDTIEKDLPVFYKTVDPIKGEQYALARIVPPAVAIPDNKLLIFGKKGPKELGIKVKSFIKGKATLNLHCTQAFQIFDKDTNSYGLMQRDSVGHVLSYTWKKDINLLGNGTEQTFSFEVSPDSLKNYSIIGIDIDINDTNVYDRSFEDINYDHIPEQILLPKSKVKLVKIDIKTSHKLIGYINGAGDDIPQMLREIGYTVEIIPPSQLATINLNKYDVIIAGVRAYNTVDRLKYDNPRLMDFVKNGGTYIVQYNTYSSYNSTLVTTNIGPYPFTLSADRTTEEDSKVTFMHPDNQVLNTPNKITSSDFDGWVQERGLYYPNKWDSNYTSILEMGDSGEKPTQGSLLVARYGKGYFVYTGLSFFRELPAGVPGAFRLFANLIELGKNAK